MMKHIELKKAILIWVPPQHEQFYRPFEAHLEDQNLHRVIESTNGGMYMTPANFSEAGSNIMTPSYQPQGRVLIENGFGESRFAFFLEIEIGMPGDMFGRRREIITGFTSHDGVSRLSGAIDPNMMFYINGRIMINDAQIPGGVTKPTVMDDSQMLAQINHIQNVVAMRPEDVVALGQNACIAEEGITVLDTRTSLSNQSMFSQRDNVLPGHYLSRICNSYLSGLSQAGYSSVGDARSDVYGVAMSNCRSKSAALDDFIASMGLMHQNGMHQFSFADINRRWLRPNDFWQKIIPPPNGRGLMSPVMYTENWGSIAMETTVAYSLTHALPAIMSRLLLLKVEIYLTNETPDGRPTIAILNPIGMFDGVITPLHIVKLEELIKLDIIGGILSSKCGSFKISMEVDLINTSSFKISLNGGPEYPYEAPMFCDSYFSPVIGVNPQNLQNINTAVEYLVQSLAPARGAEWVPNLEYANHQQRSFMNTGTQLNYSTDTVDFDSGDDFHIPNMHL